MKAILTSLLLVLLVKMASAQQADRKLVSTAGTTFKNGGYELSWSLGETMVFTKPVQSEGSFFASTGFQQPHVATEGAYLQQENWVSLYPNPVVNKTRIDIHGVSAHFNQVQVNNMLGQRVMLPATSYINGSMEVDLSNLPPGIYIITVTDAYLSKSISTRFIKQNQ